MATTLTGQMTVEEFNKLPESGPCYYELRNGELVQVTRPGMKHHRIQRQLRRLLETVAGDVIVETEVAFRALPEFEIRVAEVAIISRERWDQCDPEDHLRSAPELVIEVISPSNTVDEILEKEKLCLENGSREF